MSELFSVTSLVLAGGSVSADLEAIAEEVVVVIQLGPKPCDYCVRNAERDDPIRPPVHKDWQGTPNCHCKLVTKTVREIIEESV